MTQQYIFLPRHARRIPKKLRHHIVNHDPGLVVPRPKVEEHDHNYAVMDPWGQAMADMKAHGTMPDLGKEA